MGIEIYPFSRDEVRAVEKMLGIELGNNSFDSLMAGTYSALEDLPSPDGTRKRGKICLNRNKKTGEVSVSFFFQKETLLIPDIVLGKRVSKEEKQRLTDGQFIQRKYKGRNLYIQIDKDLRDIIVKGEKELKLPDIIGNSPVHGFEGYKLTDQDKITLLNNGKVGPKVLCGEQGFFLASFRWTEDKKGYIFSDYQSLLSEVVQEYIRKYNLKEETKTADIKQGLSEKADKNLSENQEIKSEGIKYEKADQNLDKEFYEALQNKDFKKMNELADSGYKPGEQIRNLNTLPHLSESDKTAIRTIFNIKPAAQNIINENIPKFYHQKEDIMVQKEKVSDGRKAEKIGTLVNQVFRDI